MTRRYREPSGRHELIDQNGVTVKDPPERLLAPATACGQSQTSPSARSWSAVNSEAKAWYLPLGFFSLDSAFGG